MIKINLLKGNNLETLKQLPDNSVDSVVTDPPYGLSFMGKKWDYDVPTTELWQECLRVLKPGGHLLAFFGTRTYHRGVVRIEDAGFEIRDQIQWIYGSGFPKSHNIGKAIDKAAGAEREVVGSEKNFGKTKLADGKSGFGDYAGERSLTKPATEAEKQWDGWGTALKPANEPIVVARKPLEKGLTIAENVLKYGTGAINVDECRIATSDEIPSISNQNIKNNSYKSDNSDRDRDTVYTQHTQGRWPANVILDEVTGCADWSRFFYVAKASKSERNKGLEGMPLIENANGDKWSDMDRREDKKPTLRQNFHPTVKPIKLMQYLIKLVTPPNGTVLDPFMGSGSTGVAAKELGFNFVGCELSPEYFEIAEKRING